jgi:transcriptional regulator with XRE-family HTH domain
MEVVILPEIERLQQYLLLIRRCVGWTAAEFGDRIGVTRQTINNLESNNIEKYRMSKTQYLAIRKVLDDEISSSPGDTEMLQTILEILVDHPGNYNAEDRETVLAKANMVAPAILAKSSTREDVSKDWMKSLKAGLLGVSVAALVIVSPVAAKTIVKMLKGRKA